MKMSESKKIILLLAGGALAIIVLGLTFNNRFLPWYQNDAGNPPATGGGDDQSFSNQVDNLPMSQVSIDDYQIQAAVAEKQAAKNKGLGGVTSMSDTDGMLFVFDPASEPTFWMKGMVIPIDIVWISGGKIEKIDKNVQPPVPNTSDNDLIRYPAPQTINYVLEVKGGLSDAKGFAAGDNVSISSTN